MENGQHIWNIFGCQNRKFLKLVWQFFIIAHQTIKIKTTFSVSPTSKDEIVRRIIKCLQNNKAAGGEVLLNILKKSNFTFDESTEYVNYTLKSGKFPGSLKKAAHRKDDLTDKANYRPVSVLPILSKINKRVIYNHLGNYDDLFLNKLLCGLEKHILLNTLYLNDYIEWMIINDLSKTYDCLPHDLIIAKFEAHGLSKNSLKLLVDYLKKEKQRVKTGFSCSFWSDVKGGVSQGSILGPILYYKLV